MLINNQFKVNNANKFHVMWGEESFVLMKQELLLFSANIFSYYSFSFSYILFQHNLKKH